MGNTGYRVRNCFTLANGTACTVGAGLAMIGVFAPLAFSNISPKTALSLFYVGVGLVAVGLIMAVIRYVKSPVEKKLRVFSIISVLDRMYKRLEILAGKEKNKEIDWVKFRETSDKISKLAQVTVPKVSSVNEAKEAVENLEKTLPSIFPMDAKLQEKVRKILSMSRLIDKSGFGLKDKRRGDKKYSRLLKSVDGYYDENKDIINDELRILIRSCVDYNESAVNALLFIQRTNIALAKSGIPNVLTPSMEADMEGFSDDVREIARKIRVDVGQEIKKLVKT